MNNNSDKTFYTNISVKGNHILYRGYESGEPVSKKIQYQPEIFFESNDGTYTTVLDRTKKIKRKQFDDIASLKQFVEQYKNTNFKLYGCSDMVRQFTGNLFKSEIDWSYELTKIFFIDIETEVSSGFPKPEHANERINLISVVDNTNKKTHIWALNSVKETNKIFEDGNTEFISFEDDEKKMLSHFIKWFASTRIDILSGYNSEIFDIPYIINRIKKVLGDSYIKLLSPWREIKERVITYDNGETEQAYDIVGITHLDWLVLYKKFNPSSQESFKLDHIAFIELGENKVEMPCETFKEFYTQHWETFVEYNKQDSILLYKLEKRLYQIRLAMQLSYIAKCQYSDVMSSMRLWESIIYNDFISQNIVEDWYKKNNTKREIVGAYVHTPVPGKYGWSVSLDFSSLYPSIIMQHNISPETIVGYDESITIDVVVSMKHINKVPENCIISSNGLITSKEQIGFIPRLIKQMFDRRKSTKSMMLQKKREVQELLSKNVTIEQIEVLQSEIATLDVAQNAFKTSANSLYGIMALPYFRYYDSRIAEAITTNGQVFILKSRDYLNSMLSKIVGVDQNYAIYSDTDSTYIDFQGFVNSKLKNKTDSEIVDYIENVVVNVIQPTLNKKLHELVNSMGCEKSYLDKKLECIGPSIIMVAKKRYVFDILYSEGVRYQQPTMKIMGIEVVRSSTPAVVKDQLKECLAVCMRSDEQTLQKLVKSIKSNFMKLSLKEISFPRGVNGLSKYSSKNSIYEKGNGISTPIAVRGALLYNYHLERLGLSKTYPLIGEGDKVKFTYLKMPNPIHEDVIAFPDKLPEQFGLIKYIDYKTQYEKTFLEPLKHITSAIGWDTEEHVKLDLF